MAKTNSSIKNNYEQGTVDDYLSENIKIGSELSIVLAYFNYLCLGLVIR